MFTGISRGCGVVESFARDSNGRRRLEIKTPKNFPRISIGGSVSVDGVCLTAVKKESNHLFFDVVQETIRRTHFARLEKGAHVNLEPALRWNDRIEGHFVQGHVDAVGTVKNRRRQNPGIQLEITYPNTLHRYILEKGSIAVNSVSLTICRVLKNTFFL